MNLNQIGLKAYHLRKFNLEGGSFMETLESHFLTGLVYCFFPNIWHRYSNLTLL